MQTRSFTLFATLATALVLVACTTAPLSFLVGRPLTKTDMTLYPVRVVSVDGGHDFTLPAAVGPGVREVVLEAAPGRGALNGVQKTFMMKIEPCTRYFLAARRDSPMSSDWALVVDSTETVGGCTPEEEFRKAGYTAAPAASAAR
ncbi:MAG TPA: hypothetical protein VFL64_02850 [Rhizobacter sp.]|nr:hypothetical protein [Rhizobacter sp.]